MRRIRKSNLIPLPAFLAVINFIIPFINYYGVNSFRFIIKLQRGYVLFRAFFSSLQLLKLLFVFLYN